MARKKNGWSWVILVGAVLASGVAAVSQEADNADDGMAVLGEEDLAERAEIWRNRYRRMTPGAEPLVQDVGVWPAAWEEFSPRWDSAPAERDLATWLVPVAAEREGGATVLRDGHGAELWRGTTDFAKEESASVTLTGALVNEEDWALWSAAREEIARRLESAPPMRGGSNGPCTAGLHFVSASFATSPPSFHVGLAWTNSGLVDIFAYGPLHAAETNVATFTNDENEVVTWTNVEWHAVEPGLAGLDNDWEWVGALPVTNAATNVFVDTGFPPERAKVRFYAAAEAVDTDGDGLNDGFEMFVSHSDPDIADTDGDGVGDGEEYAAGANPSASNGWWEVTTTNAFHWWRELGTNIPSSPQFIADYPVSGVRPSADSVVQNVRITGYMDDILCVDGNVVGSWAPGPKTFTGASVFTLATNVQSESLTLGVWDLPTPGHVGSNEVKLGWSFADPFRVEWDWKVPMSLMGPDFLCVGDTAQMEASGAGGGPFEWSVGRSVASIDPNGVLTALAPGMATVTATDGTSGCTMSKDVAVGKLECLDAGGMPATSLKIGKWENAFNDVLLVWEDFVDRDPDRFQIRVTDASKAGAGTVAVAVSTRTPWSTTDDGPTAVDLTEQASNPGVFVSTNLLLVSDDIDDDYSTSEVPADDTRNDRTHRVRLGGKVRVRYPAAGPMACSLDVPVSAAGTVHVIPVILRDQAEADGGVAVVDTWQVEAFFEVAQRRYAQVGVLLTWDDPVVCDPPAGVNLSDGLTVRTSASPRTLASEAKAAIAGVGTVGDTTDIHAIWVNNILVNGFSRAGSSVADYWYDSSEDDYLFNFFMCDLADIEGVGCAVAHELGHLLTDFGHPDTAESWRLMHSPLQMTGVTGSRRFVVSEESKIQGERHVH